MNYKLTQINIFPVKSLPGISLRRTIAEERGLKFDRRWMLVDSENKFITQRLFPKMIFIDIEIRKDHLIFRHKRKSLEELAIPLYEFPDKRIEVNIWGDVCAANVYEKNVNNWFERALEFKCKLVYMPDNSVRNTSTKYFSQIKNVSFADGYPYLIVGEESLNNLNSMTEYNIEMSQFRPNFVFSGGKPHDEDSWKEIIIGDQKFAVVKPCARCVITTIDLNSGNKNKEPLKTLSTYRNVDGKIMFGQNALALTEGYVSVGDKIQAT